MIASAVLALTLGAVDPNSAEGLYAECKSLLAYVDRTSKDAPWDEAKYCLGFTSGLVSGLLVAKAKGLELVCFPDGEVNYSRLARVFTLYLDAHPAESHMPAGIPYFDALQAAYPCPKK